MENRFDRRNLPQDHDPDRRDQIADRRLEFNLQFVTFHLGGRFFGFPIHRVQEISLAQAITSVPRAPDFYRGLINLRGQIIPALDLRQRLEVVGVVPRPDETFHIIVRGHEGLLCVQVDNVGDVLDVSRSHFSKAPPTVAPNLVKFIDGVCKLKTGLLVILDIDALTGA